MASKNFSVSTSGSKVTGTLTDKLPCNPVTLGTQGLQAIGPRVTFNFITDSWSSDNTYSYYDVVKNGGNTYIARKYVPEDIDISNTDYWILWAEPNAQYQELYDIVITYDDRIKNNESGISDLNNTIIEIKTSINGVEVSIDELQEALNATNSKVTTNTSNIATNTSNIATNTSNIATNTSNIATLKSQIEYINNPYLIVIGDSWSVSSTSGSPLWHELYGQHMGYTVANYATSGMGFVRPISSKTFKDKVQDAYDEHKNDNVKELILMGGLNDLNIYGIDNIETIKEAIVKCFKLINNLFPNVKVKIYGSQSFHNVLDGAVTLSLWMHYYSDLYGWEYHSMTNIFQMLTNFWQDNNHPSSSGEAYIASFVQSGVPVFGAYSNAYDSSYKSAKLYLSTSNSIDDAFYSTEPTGRYRWITENEYSILIPYKFDVSDADIPQDRSIFLIVTADYNIQSSEVENGATSKAFLHTSGRENRFIKYAAWRSGYEYEQLSFSAGTFNSNNFDLSNIYFFFHAQTK